VRPAPAPGAEGADSAAAVEGANPEFSGSEITQPIRVHAHAPGALPPGPAAPSGSPYSGTDPSGAPPRAGQEPTRLRLQLDRVGEGRPPSSPDDFIVPPQAASPQPPPAQTAPPEEAPADLGQPIESLPVEAQFGEPEGWEDSPSEAPPGWQMEQGAVPAEPGEEARTARGLGGSAPEFASGGHGPSGSDPFAGLESEAFGRPEAAGAAPSGEFEPLEESIWDKDEGALPGAEGDFGTFFGEPPVSEGPASDVARDEPATRREEALPPTPPAGIEEGFHDDSTLTRPGGGFQSSAEPASSAASAPVAGRGSDMDEMLGILGDESRGMATSTKLLLFGVVAASIIAVAAVYLVANAFGVFPGSEKPGAAPAALVQEEQANGDRAGFPQELAESAEGVRDAPAQDRPAQERDQASRVGPETTPPIIGDEARTVGAGEGQTAPPPQEGTGAITLDDRVQAIVGDPTLNPDARRSGSLIGSAALDPIVTEPTDFSGVSASSLASAEGSGEPGASDGPGGGGETTLDSADSPPSFSAPSAEPGEPSEAGTSFVGPSGEGASADAPQPRSTLGAPAAATGRRDYNPPESFPAPGPGDGPLGKTHDLLDAFLRAPDLETRLRYSYGGESLRAAMEEYHKKWPYASADRFSKKLFQIDDNPDTGGPYWVYLISSSDAEEGFPVIIRVEDGLLKVDWEIYSEFQDRHFGQFLSSSVGSSGTFRLVLDRKSRYYGPDQDTFPDLDRYLVYQVNPPYGDVDEYSKYAFVEKDTDLARRLDAAVGLGEDPLAVILSLEVRTFPHGAKHFVISDYVTEGWFR